MFKAGKYTFSDKEQFEIEVALCAKDNNCEVADLTVGDYSEWKERREQVKIYTFQSKMNHMEL